MAHGYRGKILEVDLTKWTSHMDELSKETRERFIGGSGLNAWLLYKEVNASTQAFDPENPLIFGAGPLVGTSFPTSARTTFTALSPLTGIFGDSNAGGYFGVMVKRAGYDHMIIRGASKAPCCLVIGPEGHCKIEDAGGLWERDTLETEKILKQKYPGAAVASIGPAGENRVPYACIMTNHNANSYSRAGMGAVMGAKGLKAIVVVSGTPIPVKDEKAMKDISGLIKSQTKEFAFPKLFARYGTPMFINLLESKGLVYAENWRRKIGFEDIVPLDVGSYFKAVKSKSHGCFRCPLKCGKHWRIEHGAFAGESGYGYEVAYIMSFGLSLGLRDIPAMLHLINKINRMGLDINEFCGSVGMAIDAFKKGILNEKMTDGLKLDWGSISMVETLIEKTARREGFGDILAEGTKRAAERIGGGAEKYALHMKGMHWPAHSAPPFAMAFSLSTRGGDFLKGVPYLLLQPDNRAIAKGLFGGTKKTMDIYSHQDKGRAVWWHENYKMLIDSLGICFYLGLTLLPHKSMLPTLLARANRAATGMDADGKELLLRAERGYQMERAINALRGVDGSKDRFTKRPEPDSWAQGIDLDRSGMLDEYQAYRGLSTDGLPTGRRLQEAGLLDVSLELQNHGALGHISRPKEYLPLETIMKNPSSEDFAGGLKARIRNRVKSVKMQKMAENPLELRKHFNKLGRRRRIKKWLRKSNAHVRFGMERSGHAMWMCIGR